MDVNSTTDITSPTLDTGVRATPEFTRNEAQAKFEMVQNVEVKKPKKPGFFSGLLRFLGHLAPIGAFFGPPGWIGMGAASAAGAIGEKHAQDVQQKEQQRIASEPRQVMMTPGLGGGGLSTPTANDPALETIAASREAAQGSAVRERM